MQLPINSIYVPPRVRKKHPKIHELAGSLKHEGQIQAIAVRPIDEHDEADTERFKPGQHKWALVAGGRRLSAAIFLDWEEIRADNLDEMSLYRRLKLELEENLQREQLDFVEEVETKARLHELYKTENPEHTLVDTAQLIGESLANLGKDVQLAQEIRKDPSLAKAGSKKAALQIVKQKEFARGHALRMESLGQQTNTLQERIVTADMKDWLRQLPTGSIDLLASDLPYGIDYFDRTSSGGEMGGKHHSEFDDTEEGQHDLLTDVVPQLLRVTAETGWLVLMAGWEGCIFLKRLIEECCVVHFEYTDPGTPHVCMGAKDLGNVEDCIFLRLPPKPWIWYRPNSRNQGLHPSLHARNMYEPILVVNRGKGMIVSTEHGDGNVLVYDSEYSERFHAHQKPREMWTDIIDRFTLRGAMVADCCYGSGSALAAAAELDRKFMGCDKNPGMREPAIGYVSQYWKGEVRKKDG